jgi:hypothetical protein
MFRGIWIQQEKEESAENNCFLFIWYTIHNIQGAVCNWKSFFNYQSCGKVVTYLPIKFQVDSGWVKVFSW